MVDHVVPSRHTGERAAQGARTAEFRAFVRSAEATREVGGHHHRNHVLPLTESMARLLGRPAGTPVTVRVRRTDALPVVIRTWQDEAAVLRALRGVLPHAPECLAERDGFAVHRHVDGVTLSAVCPNGKPVDSLLLQALAGVLARMTQVRRAALPPLPPSWPANHSDSQAFVKTLARLADEQIRRPNWAEFGGLFKALGIADDALLELAGRVPAMTRRPYSLLHGDLHRDNLIVSYDGTPPLICVDWELASYGDPLHDLATHLVRMHYPDHQWAEVIDAWTEEMARSRPAAVKGLKKDLRHYLDFERAQSVYPDVMRAARSLLDTLTQKSLDEAAAQAHRALRRAEEPLRLRNVPTEGEIERALFRWLASRGDGDLGGRHWTAKARDWQPDPRFTVRPDFPESAVRDALLAEGAAPAHRVFKGTAHLNSVVQVGGTPVVVRRKLPVAYGREPKYLSEHAVLRAIQDSGAPVAAPRVLALGESHPNDPFAIHTYVGTVLDEPPSHPVGGLLPHEADALVDQLRALTRVDHTLVIPDAGETDFYEWLTEQLVDLVRNLPKESLQLARTLGLPDDRRLREILSRHCHRLTRRTPALLHGDLNPWNLVRRADPLALTLIDWEMALVGDPLYDLVRHIHLTPTRQEIRERMFARWELTLAPEHTANWRQDWSVYRWIEIVRSAYIDLDRLVTGAGLDAPNVRRAVNSYAGTLAAAIASLGLPTPATANPYLARALT